MLSWAALLLPLIIISSSNAGGTEVKPTKTNSEISAHSGKCGKDVEVCFPGATKASEALKASKSKDKKGKDDKGGKKGGKKLTKKELKAAEAAMFDMAL